MTLAAAIPVPLRRLANGVQIVAEFIQITLREFVADRLMLRALALTYGTLLSLVPLLALLFSLFKLLGGGPWFIELVRPALENFLAPGVEPVVTERLTRLLSRFAAKTIGGVGLALLILGVHGIFTAVEMTFNIIWGGAPRGRFLLRLPLYWGLFIAIPLLLAGSLALTTYISALPIAADMVERVGFLEAIGRRLIPAAMIVVSFFLIYRFLPTAPVIWSSALMGAVVGGAVYEVVKHLFIFYITRLVKYDVLYGSLAIAPMVMVWINLSWIVTLFGVEVAYVHQHFPALRREQKHRPLSRRQRDALAYRLLLATSAGQKIGNGWVKVGKLAEQWQLPPGAAVEVVAQLERGGIIRRRTSGDDHIRLARAGGEIPLSAVERALTAETSEAWNWPRESLWTALRNWLKLPTGRRAAEAKTVADLSELLTGEATAKPRRVESGAGKATATGRQT